MLFRFVALVVLCTIICSLAQPIDKFYDLPTKTYNMGKGTPAGIVTTDFESALYVVWPSSIDSHFVEANGTISSRVASVDLPNFAVSFRDELVQRGRELYLVGVLSPSGQPAVMQVHLTVTTMFVVNTWKLTETPPQCLTQPQYLISAVMMDDNNLLAWGHCTLYHYSLKAGGEATLVHKLDGLTVWNHGFLYTNPQTQQPYLVLEKMLGGVYVVSLSDFSYVMNDKLGVPYDQLQACSQVVNLQSTTTTSTTQTTTANNKQTRVQDTTTTNNKQNHLTQTEQNQPIITADPDTLPHPAFLCRTQYSYPCSILFTYSISNNSWTAEKYNSCPWRYVDNAALNFIDTANQIVYFSLRDDYGRSDLLLAYGLRQHAWLARGQFGLKWPYQPNAVSAVLSGDGKRVFIEGSVATEKGMHGIHVVSLDQFLA